MLQTAHSRRIRTVIAAGIYLILAAGAFFVGGHFFENDRLMLVGMVLFLNSEIVFLCLFWHGAHRHHIERGQAYAKTHYNIEKSVLQELFDAGIYVERHILMKKCALLPRLVIEIDDSLTFGSIRIENSIKFDHRMEELPISSALPEKYILTAAYISDDNNEYIFQFEEFSLDQLVFYSYDCYAEHVNQVGTYDLFFNNYHVLSMHHMILIGQTGSGKSYALYALILQMLSKKMPWEIFIIDPKMSGLYTLGCAICRDKTAYTVDDSIAVLQAFSDRMMKRKEEMQENLSQRLDADYRDFGLAPIVLIVDEYTAFSASLSRYDKKTRDFVNEVIGNNVREGRQLGCFLIVAQQQTNATNFPTELKENVPIKIILGDSERQTYITAIGTYPDIARRHFDPGQGLLVSPGISTPEMPAVTTIPSLHFDILSAVSNATYSGESCGHVMTTAPQKEFYE